MTQTEVKFVAEYCKLLVLYMSNGVLEYYDEYGYHLVLMPKDHRKAIQVEVVNRMYPYRKYFSINLKNGYINYYLNKINTLPE